MLRCNTLRLGHLGRRRPWSLHAVLRSTAVRRAAFVAGALGILSLVSVSVASSGCASEGPECTRGSDCATGACNATGRCVPSDEADAAKVDGAVEPGTDGSTATDGDATTQRDVVVPDGGCLPNKDFRILRDEVPLAAGLRATYKVARDVDVATAGTPGPNDTRSWDFSGDLRGDTLSLVETQRSTTSGTRTTSRPRPTRRSCPSPRPSSACFRSRHRR